MIGAAHLGLFLLLTAKTSKRMAADEIAYTIETLEEAQDPGPPPRDPTLTQGSSWNRDQEVWEHAVQRRKDAQYVALLGYGLLGSFLVQALVTGVLLYRSAHSRMRVRSRGPTRRVR